jgi:ABC-type Fe3+/spermidine/putrescine transport system ATPase subunit
MAAPIAEVSLVDVSKRFGEITAIRRISLQIRQGEFLTLLGPSGSGKTTLLRLIGGFDHPTSGRVLIRGEDVTGVPPNRRNTSTVFQDLALFPHMSVGRNVAYGLMLRGMPETARRERAEHLLALVGLEGFYHRNVTRLSGGQRQRVALARSLVLEPAVLLLDEPLTGLDEKFREQMQVELKSLHARLGTTFVAVTHNQEEALSMSDRVAVLRDGRLEQIGAPGELYEAPRTEFVADFIGSANLLQGQLADVATMRFQTNGLTLHARGTGNAAVGPAVLMVRPERIILGPDASRLTNQCVAQVQAVIYKGAVVEVYLVLGSGQRLRAHQVTGGHQQIPVAGSRITIGWDVGDSILLPPSSGSEADGPGEVS